MRQLFSSIPGQVLDFIVALMCIALLFREKLGTFAKNLMDKIFDQSFVEKTDPNQQPK